MTDYFKREKSYQALQHVTKKERRILMIEVQGGGRFVFSDNNNVSPNTGDQVITTAVCFFFWNFVTSELHL
jgi:hypothetical protein